MKEMKKILAFFLCFVMVLGFVPASAFAALAAETETTVPQEDTVLTAALAEAKGYVDGITINNSSNDPATVVKNFKTHFTWDNEKRENSKSYLFDWSYYNGVVFEGIEYLYEVTGASAYKDYVVEYMSNLIASDGTWAKTSNNASMTAAGYDATHGADCYKTASLLLDAYKMTGDSRYLTMATTLYADLDTAAKTYSLSKAGNNFRHTWSSDPSPDLWLDGLYMILPFRAEYAKYINDTEELDLIVSRMQWVSDNMYDEDEGLFYHAADSASSNSGTFWLRSIGWYAAAIVDVMDSMEGENLETMKTQLKKLVDGMKACQNPNNGMWLNNMGAEFSAKVYNPYETSGTALMCYAVMKAVNNGWLDESYADMAILAFKGICTEKLNGSNLTDICFKGTPGDSNSTFYDNEGKGVGPFIMFYAEVLEYANKLVAITVTAPDKTEYEVGEELDLTGMTVTAYTRNGEDSEVTSGYTVSDVDMDTAGAKTVTVTYRGLTASFEIVVNEPSEPEETEPVKEEVEVTVGQETVKVTVENVANVVTGEASAEDKAVVDAAGLENVLVFDMTAVFVEGATKAVVSISVPAGWDQNRIVGISVEDGVLKLIPGTVENGVFSYAVDHFSAKGIALAAAGDVLSGEGNLVGSSTYTIDTNGVNAGEKYLIANTNGSSNVYVLTNNNGNVGRTPVTPGGTNNTNRTITVADDTNIAWVFGGTTSGTVRNGQNNNYRYVYPNYGSLSLNTSGTSMTISDQDDGEYRIYRYSNDYYYYLTYSGSYNANWTGARTRQENSVGSVYLYRLTDTSDGEEVIFTIAPTTTTIQPEGTVALNGTVTVDGKSVDLDDCTITYTSGNTNVLTVDDDGTVTGVADGRSTTVQATLSAVDGTALQENIVLLVNITVQSKTIASIDGLVGSPVTVVAGAEPDYSGVSLAVTYNDGTHGTIPYSRLDFYEVDTSMPGTKTVTVTYGDWTGNLIVNVIISYPDKEATSYPEYPADGAVRVDKTATELEFDTTGVVEVELDVAGVSVKGAVDIILVADISNSMAWMAGKRNVSPDASKGETTKWQDLQAAAGSFIDILLEDNGDDSATNNTVSFVTFGGFDAERNDDTYSSYFDATRTVFVGADNAEDAKNAINSFSINGNDGDGYTMTINGVNAGAPQGGTNYDYAFLEAATAINALKAQYTDYDKSGRQIYIIFMTDGAPDHYNQLYYKYRSGTQFDLNALYRNNTDFLPGNYFTAQAALPTYTSLTRHVNNGYYMPSTDTTISNADWIDWIQKDSLYAAEEVLKIENVVSITSVGFDLENGGFSTYSFGEEVLNPVLKDLAGEDSCEVFTTADKAELDEFYKTLATKIKYAGTAAQVTDTIGSEFTLQMGATTGAISTDHDTGLVSGRVENLEDYGITPEITIKAYDLWTKAETDDTSLIGTRKVNDKGEYIYTTLEKVTFNPEGTEAYTSANGEGNTINIMTVNDGSVVIAAKYFTYTKTPDGVETFKWIIGNITDKEITLSFLAYLKGSLEGEHPKGLVYTNEEATLEYIDINGDYAHKEFPVPAVAWGGASTAYEFYLVNENGEPCDRNGNIVPFANRIIITGPFFEELYLNQAGEYVSETIAAAYVLPTGYVLFDETANYSVITASGGASGKLNISLPYVIAEEGYTGTLYEQVTDAEGNISYVESASGTYKKIPQTTILVSAVTPSYIQSRVAFGVMYNQIPDEADFELVPDVVVIDFGLPVVIDIFANNTELEAGYAPSLVGFSKYYDTVDMNHKFTSTSSLRNFNTSYGNFSIESAIAGTARYTPTTFVDGVETVFCTVKMDRSSDSDFYYMVDKLTVIPATTVYYEDEFVELKSYDNSQYAEVTYSADSDKTLAYYTLSDGKYTKVSSPVAGTTYYVHKETSAWVVEGTTLDKTQASDRPGDSKLSFEIDADNVYGYDAAYDSCSEYSMGSARRISVNANQYGTAEFSFYGTGFDVIALTSNTTGTLIVQVFNEDGTVAKTASVDTYYGYTYGIYEVTYTLNEDGKWEQTTIGEALPADSTEKFYDSKDELTKEKRTENEDGSVTATGYIKVWKAVENDPNALYQVPVMKISGLEYGKYTAKISALYYSSLDHTTGTDGYDLYLDAIRIYDPAGTNKEANDAYVKDGEGYPEYVEIRNEIIKESGATVTPASMGRWLVELAKDENGNEVDLNGFMFIDGNANNDSLIAYVHYGPNNEVYLTNKQAVTFNVDLSKFVNAKGESIVADVQVGLKLAYGELVYDDEGNVVDGGAVYQTEYQMYNAMAGGAITSLQSGNINSATEMYYSIKDLLSGTVVITNTGDGILSITNLKITFTEEPVSTIDVPGAISIDGESATNAVNSLSYVTPSTANFNPESMDIAFNRTKAEVGNNIIVTVTTSSDVKDLLVNGRIATNKTTSYLTGETTWSFTVPVVDNGSLKVTVVGYDSNGEYTVPYSESVTVINQSGTAEDLLGKLFG